MYEAFYRLAEPPFRLTPDPRYLFLSAQHREALGHLLFGIREGSGFIAVTGEIGTGKTTLIRTLLLDLEPTTKVAYIFNPVLSDLELLQAINGELQLPATSTSKKELTDELNRFLLAQKTAGARVVVIVDEAQNLSAPVLEQLRLLSNLETETEKLLQIVLVGQPELREMLHRPELAQLHQRITVRWHLAPLDHAETIEYIRHRLRVAGGERATKLFTPAAVRHLYRYSGGVPRLINIAAHHALLVGFTRERRTIGARVARQAVVELERDERGPERPPTLRPFLGAAAAALVLALGAALALVPWPRRFALDVGSDVLAPPEGAIGAAADAPPAGAFGMVDREPPGAALAPGEAEPPAHDLPDPGAFASKEDTVEPAEGTDAGSRPAAEAAPQPAAAAGAPATDLPAATDGPPAPVTPLVGPLAVAAAPSATAAGAEPSATAAQATPAPAATPAQGTEATGSVETAGLGAETFWAALAASDNRSTAVMATLTLLDAWHVEPLTAEERSRPSLDLWAIAARRSLHYLPASGNLQRLELLDVPAILELSVPPTGQRRFAVLVALANGNARLRVGEIETVLAADQLAGAWLGDAHILWRDFEDFSPYLSPGTTGREVERLQAMLARVGELKGTPSSRYDRATVEAIARFQRSRRLTPDGIVGPLTKILLYSAVGGYDYPSLGGDS